MCGSADFSALGSSLTRLAAISLAGGSILAIRTILRTLKELFQKQENCFRKQIVNTSSKEMKRRCLPG